MNVEVKSRGSGKKTVVPIEEVWKGIKYGKDLTGYEKNMLGNGIGKMESKDYVYTVINSSASTNPVVQNALAAVACNAKIGESVWWYCEEDQRVYKGFKITKIYTDGTVEIYRPGEGSFTVPRRELYYPGGFSISWNSSNALEAKGVAKNADESMKVKVVADIETLFGKKHMETTMTIGQLKAAFAKIGHARLFADVERNFDAGKGGDVNVAFPCEVYFTMA